MAKSKTTNINSGNLPERLRNGNIDLKVTNLGRLLKQFKDIGIDNENCLAAIMGILSIECGFLNQEEDFHYSKTQLLKTWTVSDDIATKYSQPNFKGTKEEFFGYFYGLHQKPPRTLKDGGTYYGRGLMQITFKDGYKSAMDKCIVLGKALGDEKNWTFDFVSNPELVMSSENNADIKAAVGFLVNKFGGLDKFKKRQSEPDIFLTLCRMVNANQFKKCPGVIQEKKKCYEFFLTRAGIPVPIMNSVIDPKPTNKDAGTNDTSKSTEEIALEPKNKQEALTESRDENFSKIGFTDPSGKYPLRDYMNEADTNRLARGNIKNTCVEFKDSIRNAEIPSVNDSKFNQPAAPYASMYPYNKVMESEGGHVLEFDDTPNAERVNLYHRKGSFIEIDNNGTQVNHIVGDGYWITERNGNVFVKGTCNITVLGDLNLLCEGNSTVEVNGTADTIFHNDASINVAKNLAINVGENFEISVGKNFNIEYGKIDELPDEEDKENKTYGGMTFKTPYGKLAFESPSDITFKAGAAIRMESATTTTINSTGDFLLYTPTNASIKASTINLSGDNVPLAKYVKLTATDSNGDDHTQLTEAGKGTNTEPTTPNQLTVSYNPQSTVVVGDEDTATNTTSESIYFKRNTLTGKYPEVRSPSNANFEPLEPCERVSSLSTKYEGDLDATGNALFDKQSAEYSQLYGNQPDFEIQNDDEKLTASAENSGALDNSSVSTYTAKIGSKLNANRDENIHQTIANNSGKSFPPNFKISKHFVLGNFMPPGVIPMDITLQEGSFYPEKGKMIKYKASDLVDNLASLAESICEPIYDLLGPLKGKYGTCDPSGKWNINDGLRTMSHKGGNMTSDHYKGRAIDMRFEPKRSHEDMYNLAIQLSNSLPAFSQMILEYDKGSGANWIHIAFNPNFTNDHAVKKMTGVCVNGKNPQYTHGKFILYK